MGIIKGQKQYEQFMRGENLSRSEAILAQCYICNGFEEGGCDCLAKMCPLYQYFPYGAKVNCRTLSRVKNSKEGAEVPSFRPNQGKIKTSLNADGLENIPL